MDTISTQKTLRYALPADDLRPAYTLRNEARCLNNPTRKVPPEKLLSDLLKRQMRRVMSDITECPSDTLPAHLARLDDFRDIVGHLVRHDLAETAESRLSGAQLAYPSTLADFLACLDITRRQHRAPVFVNQRDEELAGINRKIDMLAGFLLIDREALNFFSNRQPRESEL
jgi:hypothetical protein